MAKKSAAHRGSPDCVPILHWHWTSATLAFPAAERPQPRSFPDANAFAQFVGADPALKELYHHAGADETDWRGVALKDFAHPPTIDLIECLRRADDPRRVVIGIEADKTPAGLASIWIELREAGGQLVEEGPAICGRGGWSYDPASDLGGTSARNVVVSVVDFPGQEVTRILPVPADTRFRLRSTEGTANRGRDAVLAAQRGPHASYYQLAGCAEADEMDEFIYARLIGIDRYPDAALTRFHRQCLIENVWVAATSVRATRAYAKLPKLQRDAMDAFLDDRTWAPGSENAKPMSLLDALAEAREREAKGPGE